MLAGATWALLSGFLYTVYMGVSFSWLITFKLSCSFYYLFSKPSILNVQSGLPQTFLLSKNIWLPYFPNTRLDLGF